MNITYFKVE